MTDKKETFEVELFIFSSFDKDKEFKVSDHDMTGAGLTLLGSQVVTLDVPDVDINECELRLAESQLKVIQERVDALRAKMYNPDDILNSGVNE